MDNIGLTSVDFFEGMTVDQFCQWLLNNRASVCWTIVPATVEQSCQWLLNICASDCWRIMPGMLKNRASDCWTIRPVTVDELYQRLLKNCASDCWRIMPGCWIVMPAVFFSLFNLLWQNPYQFFKQILQLLLFQFRITIK